MERPPTIHSHKKRTYLTPVQSVLLYAFETWTLTSADSRSLEAFHMKCQRRILRISWQQFVRSEEVRAQTGLSSVLDIISRRHIFFGHITRLQDSVPAYKTLAVHVSSSLDRPPDSSWRRRLGRPRGRWLDRSGGTAARLLPITGDRHKGEGRYGLRWLRDDDDDMNLRHKVTE